MVSRPALMKRLRKGFDPDLWQSPQGDWREGLLSLLLRVILFLAPWVYFPSLYMCYVGGYGFIALTDTIAIVGFVCLYYFRGISFTAKAFGFALKFGLLWMSVRCSHSLACRFSLILCVEHGGGEIGDAFLRLRVATALVREA